MKFKEWSGSHQDKNNDFLKKVVASILKSIEAGEEATRFTLPTYELQELGKALELATYAYLTQKGLKPENIPPTDVSEKLTAFYASIGAKNKGLIEQHAAFLGEAMLKDHVLPPVGVFLEERELTISYKAPPARPLIVESPVRVNDMSIKDMYVLMGGKHLREFTDKLESLEGEEKRKFVMDVIDVLLDNLMGVPSKLNFVLSKLVPEWHWETGITTRKTPIAVTLSEEKTSIRFEVEGDRVLIKLKSHGQETCQPS